MMSEKYSIGVSGDHENDLDYYNKNLKGDTLIIVGLDSSVAYETTPQEIYDALKKVGGEIVAGQGSLIEQPDGSFGMKIDINAMVEGECPGAGNYKVILRKDGDE